MKIKFYRDIGFVCVLSSLATSTRIQKTMGVWTPDRLLNIQ